MIIVAFGFAKRAGKDTSAKFLDSLLRTERPGLKVRKVSFAAKLKDISWQLYGWAGLQPGVYYETTEGEKEKEIILPEIGMSPREIWIKVGNAMRTVFPDTWLMYALRGIKADVIIITDLRFKNEGQAIIDRNGWCYEVDRPGIEKGHDAAEVDLIGWLGFKAKIKNGGTLADLHKEIEVIGLEVLAAL